MHDYLKHFHEEELHNQEVLAAHSKRTDDIQLIKDEVLAKSRAELETHRNVAAMKIFGVRYRAGALLNKDIHTRNHFAFQFSKSQGSLDEENAYFLQFDPASFGKGHERRTSNIGLGRASLNGR